MQKQFGKRGITGEMAKSMLKAEDDNSMHNKSDMYDENSSQENLNDDENKMDNEERDMNESEMEENDDEVESSLKEGESLKVPLGASSSSNSSSPIASHQVSCQIINSNTVEANNNWNQAANNAVYTNYVNYTNNMNSNSNNSNFYSSSHPAAFSQQNFYHFNMIQPLSASSPSNLSAKYNNNYFSSTTTTNASTALAGNSNVPVAQMNNYANNTYNTNNNNNFYSSVPTTTNNYQYAHQQTANNYSTNYNQYNLQASGGESILNSWNSNI